MLPNDGLRILKPARFLKQTDEMIQKDLEYLNEKYRPLSPIDRIRELYHDFNDVLVTSSFGTTSAILLKMVHEANQDQPIHFIDTTFIFRETQQYKNELKELLGLRIIDVKPDPYLNQYTRTRKTWEMDTDTCCAVNKISPIESIKKDYEVWVSGLMGWQSSTRGSKDFFELKDGIIKFHPIIDMNEREADLYLYVNDLPEHPLKKLGYDSVGCTHCTKKGKMREGRWSNETKTECGLHA